MTTVTFALLAYSQARTQIEISDFDVNISKDSIASDRESLTSSRMELEQKSFALQKLILIMYSTCFSFCMHSSIVFLCSEEFY